MPGVAPVPVLNLNPAPGPGAQSVIFTPNVGGSSGTSGRNWFVRIGGSNSNGGDSPQLTPERSGSDGNTVNTTTKTFTSATAAFTSADVGRGITINTGAANPRRCRITVVNSSTSVDVERAVGATLTNTGWAIGGAWADARPAIGTTAIAVDSNSPVRGGDTIWIGAGTYRVTHVTGASWPSPTGPVQFIGDVDGVMTGDAGDVIWSGYTSGDNAAASGLSVFSAGAGLANFVQFRNLIFISGGTNVILSDCVGLVIDRCVFIAAGAQANVWGVSTNSLRYQRRVGARITNSAFCGIYNANNTILVVGGSFQGTGFDTYADFVIENCIIEGNVSFSGGANANKVGGTTVRNCTFPMVASMALSGNSLSQIYPIRVLNNYIIDGNGVPMTGGTAAQLFEDWNLCWSGTVPATSTSGGHSVFSTTNAFPPLIENLGFVTSGRATRLPYEPRAGSPAVGFGSDGSHPQTDFLGRPRPPMTSSGSKPAAGALERGNVFIKETTTVHTGSNAISYTGFGSHDFQMPVIAGTTYQPSVYCNADTNYRGAQPYLELINGGECGVSPQRRSNPNQTGDGTWYLLQLNPFAAVSNGIVTIRVVSQDTSAASKVVFDTFSDGKQ